MTRIGLSLWVTGVFAAASSGMVAGAELAPWYDRTTFTGTAEAGDLRVIDRSGLVHGPTLGCVTDTSARFWVRTKDEAEVVVVAIGKARPDRPPPDADRREVLQHPHVRRSEAVRTSEETDFTAVAEVKGLQPGTVYEYQVLIDGVDRLTEPRPEFRTYPAAGKGARFRVAFGGGARYIPANEGVWDTIGSFDPAAMLFLGDNVYIDEPRDYQEQRDHYYRRQGHPAFRRLAASTAVYAVWDDHDFGTNDCSGGLDPFRPDWKPKVWEVFRQNWNNPYYGGGERQPGCWFDFSIADVDFFMTDGRYYRDFSKGTMLGPAQKRWLLEKLAASKATFRVIASGTLWTPQADKGGRDSWEGVAQEREEIFSLVDRRRIDGVVLLSADRHRSEVWKIERPGGYPLYEFESSKLTNTHTHGTRRQAVFSYNRGNLFGLLEFDTTLADPTLEFRIVNAEGETVYTLRLKRSEMSHPPR